MYINPSVEKVGSLEKINGAMPLHMYRMGLSCPLRTFPPPNGVVISIFQVYQKACFPIKISF